MQIWAEPFTKLRVPKMFDLRADPYESRRHHLEHLLRLGGSTTPTWWSRRRPGSRSSSTPSPSSRRRSARRASRSTRSASSCSSSSTTSAAGSSHHKGAAACRPSRRENCHTHSIRVPYACQTGKIEPCQAITLPGARMAPPDAIRALQTAMNAEVLGQPVVIERMLIGLLADGWRAAVPVPAPTAAVEDALRALDRLRYGPQPSATSDAEARGALLAVVAGMRAAAAAPAAPSLLPRRWPPTTRPPAPTSASPSRRSRPWSPNAGRARPSPSGWRSPAASGRATCTGRASPRPSSRPRPASARTSRSSGAGSSPGSPTSAPGRSPTRPARPASAGWSPIPPGSTWWRAGPATRTCGFAAPPWSRPFPGRGSPTRAPTKRAARERILGWAEALVPDRDWFIQKAVAWWLRSLSIHDPARVRAFVDGPGRALKPFARREALRRLGVAG